MTNNNNTGVAAASGEQRTLADMLNSPKYQSALAAALPKHITPERMARVVMTAVNRVPALKACTPENMWQCVMDCASLGLEPDSLGRAYIIPYGRAATLIIGYKGLIDLAYRTGEVKTIHADVVYEADQWEFEKGTEERLRHVPNMLAEDRGRVVCIYAYARLKSGAFESVVLSQKEVEGIRARSKAGKSGPWVSDWGEMAKKTAIRRLAKTLPLSPEFRDAVAKDNEIDLKEVEATVRTPFSMDEDTQQEGGDSERTDG